jgi:hypothetical protein
MYSECTSYGRYALALVLYRLNPFSRDMYIHMLGQV